MEMKRLMEVRQSPRSMSKRERRRRRRRRRRKSIQCFSIFTQQICVFYLPVNPLPVNGLKKRWRLRGDEQLLAEAFALSERHGLLVPLFTASSPRLAGEMTTSGPVSEARRDPVLRSSGPPVLRSTFNTDRAPAPRGLR
ncbi:hypothetical protein EYF80_030359 [Liparis tanakae]|uniref:Uncharacterized protein n=1 Tax=Liparis tanakae TaxID=230148 RepID=A0A4Z2H3Q0_9TELE|nr:hypothetical protein EYF80_030359 [Liparis tanakae]